MPCSTWCLLAVLIVHGPLTAQEITPEELRRRFEQGEPLGEVEWKVDADGEPWMSPDPAAGGDAEWGPVFPARAGGLMPAAMNLGVLGYLNLLLTGPRDLASLGDCEKLLAMGGRDTRPASLRQRIVTPVTAENPARARRAELERVLAVRLVQERGLVEARTELQTVARDSDASPFLKRAAQDALRALDGAVLPPTAVPTEALAEVPELADVVFFVDQARVPPAFFLPRLAREAGTYVTYRDILRAGGNVSPVHLAAALKLAEMASLLPFELARSYGNARLDWSVGAVKVTDRRVAFWLEAGGMFEYQSIAARLRAKRFSIEEEDGTLRADDLPYGTVVELSAVRVRVHGADFTGEPDPERAVELRKAGLGDAPVWIHVPEGSRILAELPLPAAPRTATLTATFDGGVTLRLSSEHDNKVHAQGVESLLGGFLKQAQRLLEELEPAPAIEKALGVLRSVKLQAEGESFTATVRIRGMTPDDVLDLFRRVYRR